jgi:hypothetical protein
MPSFSFDISEFAVDWVRQSIKDMPGNPGQETLVKDLDIDCSCFITVDIAGRSATAEADGVIRLNSNHPEAIEQIIDHGEESFEEFIYYINNLNEAPNYLAQLKFNYISEGFDSL